MQHIGDVATCATVLVGHCLLQDMLESYRLHDLVLEYLQLVVTMDDSQTLAGRASSRQAQYLGRLDVFKEYYAQGKLVRTGGAYSLAALWSAIKKLDPAIDVEARLLESVKGVTDIDLWRDVGLFLRLLVRLGSLVENLDHFALAAGSPGLCASVKIRPTITVPSYRARRRPGQSDAAGDTRLACLWMMADTFQTRLYHEPFRRPTFGVRRLF